MISCITRILPLLLVFPLVLAPAVGRAAKAAPGNPKPNLIVGSTVVAPMVDGKVKAGARLIFGFSVKNVGSAATDEKSTFSVDCTVVKGGECPVHSSERPLPVIEPGQWKSVNLVQSTAAEPGTYRVTVSVQPTTRRKPTQVEIKVVPPEEKK